MPGNDDALEIARALQEIAPAPEPELEVPGEPPPPVADPLGLFDRIVTDPELVGVARSLFSDGYYALAVEEATKFVNNLVKDRSKSELDGAKMMAHVFSKDAPVLRVNDLKTESKINQQIGYAMILQGAMTGIRNPRAHEHAYLDEPHNALEMLALCNHVVRVIRKATKTRKGRRRPDTRHEPRGPHRPGGAEGDQWWPRDRRAVRRLRGVRSCANRHTTAPKRRPE